MALKSLIFILLVVKSYGLYANSSLIVTLNTHNFDSLVKDGKEIWVVQFFAPWCKHCQNFLNEYEKTARAVDGIVKLGAVNAEDNPALVEEYNVQEFPTIKIFNSHKGIPDDYRGDHSASALVSLISIELHTKINSRLDGNLDHNMFKTKETVELTEANFDDLVLSPRQIWLVVYYSPFSKKCEKLSSQWKKVAADLHGMIKLGALNSIIHFAKTSDSKIEGYPAIKFFPQGNKKANSGMTYAGKQMAEAIILWTLEKLSENAPNPKISQIIDFDSLKVACENRPLCIVSVLPHILHCPSKCRNDYLDILRKVGETNKRTLWGWVWSEAAAQPEIEDALEISHHEHPTIVAVNVKKMKYSVLVGPPTLDAINTFVEDLSYGRTTTKSLKIKQIPVIKNIAPWDGLDGPTEGTDFEDAEDGKKDEL